MKSQSRLPFALSTGHSHALPDLRLPQLWRRHTRPCDEKTVTASPFKSSFTNMLRHRDAVSPLESAFTKNAGCHPLPFPLFRSNLASSCAKTIRLAHLDPVGRVACRHANGPHPFFSLLSLLSQRVIRISFAFKWFRTLFENCRVSSALLSKILKPELRPSSFGSLRMAWARRTLHFSPSFAPGMVLSPPLCDNGSTPIVLELRVT